ncbi:DUF2752 domain-containing protein [Gordonia terrae]|uniref:DUF2752 domain-containing protein n=2 Tax=Gordonia terrae TaxID=2055 RepID=A0AAD0K903_9ACTN|nr:MULTISPECIES: DUF2752 domain-containing protein [Gordonia]VTR10915.1 Protein of uncharacterised function (DUF2752) [Clostridioides difficile]ANY24428.1 hypothetical protein BCM27_17940 [Gordonia terrae]AWO85175.1 DUF2752 domain-containing protein [Gordonia terrae]VTS58933.1 Protein of uncharacterised function (DUF2752) [Gordonia terrae]GAB46810.1 hypothetical protein GOTRE_181_00890 [Gordonia terrae NBRC 100016]
MTLDHRREQGLSATQVVGATTVAVAGAAALGAACVFTPGGVDNGPQLCPFAVMTGLPCPGCGLTRSWVALMHGDVGSAFTFNVFGPVFLVLTAVTVVTATLTLVRRRGAPLSTWRDLVLGPVGAVLLGVWLTYGVVRILDAAFGWGVFPIVV